MRRNMLVLVALVLLTAAPARAQQFPINPGEMPAFLPPGHKAKTGTGRLRGRVVAADTGAIVWRAQVRISSPDIGSKTAFTDAQGRYEFKPGEDVDGFEIVLTKQSQRVTGAVTDDKGEPLKEYTIVVFAEDPQKWTLPSGRWTVSARPDQQGHFRFEQLPAGAYLAIAVEYVVDGEWMDPEWIARAAKNATQFTLDEGSVRTLDLKLSGS